MLIVFSLRHMKNKSDDANPLSKRALIAPGSCALARQAVRPELSAEKA